MKISCRFPLVYRLVIRLEAGWSNGYQTRENAVATSSFRHYGQINPPSNVPRCCRRVWTGEKREWISTSPRATEIARQKRKRRRASERTARQRWGVCIQRLSASNDEGMKFLASYSDVRDIWRYDRRMNFIFRLATFQLIYFKMYMYIMYMHVRSTREASGQGKGGARCIATHFYLRTLYIFICPYQSNGLNTLYIWKLHGNICTGVRARRCKF